MSKQRRSAVMKEFLKYKRLSPKQIASLLNVSPGTAFNIIRDLLGAGLIKQVGMIDSRVGRRPMLYSINPSAAYAITIDMTDYDMKIKVIDLSMNPVYMEEFFYDREIDRGVNFEILVKQLEKINKKISNRAIGIGIGVSGIVDKRQGIVINNRLAEFNTLNQLTFFGDHLDLPVYIENDANLSALAEAWNSGEEDVFYIFLGDGVGAGIIKNGILYKGSHGYAGEICDSYLLKGNNEYKKVNDILSTVAIEEEVSSRMGKKIRFPEIAKIYRENNEENIRAVINDKIDFLSALLANIVTTLDPKIIIVGGDYVELGEKFLEAVRKKAKALLSYPFNVNFRIKYREYEENISLGAAYFTFQNWFDRSENMM